MSLRNFFVGKTDDSGIQIARNIVVEAVRIGVNSLILFLMVEFVLGKQWLGICTFVASMLSGLLNYVLSTIWVFHKKQKKGNLLRFAVFTAIGGVGLALNIGITKLLTECCGVYYIVSNLIAQAVVFFFNFFARKYIVYTWLSE